MLIVDIKINKDTIYHLTARNIGKVTGKTGRAKKDTKNTEWRRYKLWDGCILEHNRKKGALCLFIQMVGHRLMCEKAQEYALAENIIKWSGGQKQD